jgi:hypothetical protein
MVDISAIFSSNRDFDIDVTFEDLSTITKVTLTMEEASILYSELRKLGAPSWGA